MLKLLKFRYRNSHTHVTAWLVLLLLLTGVSPVYAAKKPALPPRLGILTRQLYPELAEDLGAAKGLKGFVILCAYQGSPAESAGVKPGDVLVKIQRAKAKPVELLDETRYQSALKGLRADQNLTLFVVRDGKETQMTLRPSTAEFGPPVQPPSNPSPATLKVASDGSEEVRTLTGALLRARPGDKVLISGKQEAATVWLDNLTLAPVDPAASTEVAGLGVIQAKEVKIGNLTFTAPGAPTQGQPGIDIYDAKDVTVENCRIQGFMEGMRVIASDGIVLDSNTVSQNVGGIDAQASTIKITRNLVLRNAKEPKGWMDFCGGIRVVGGSADITQNTILENQVPPERFKALLPSYGPVGVGIFVDETTAVVANNLVLSNTIGVMVGAKAQATVEYNDVFNHAIQGGVWTGGNNEYHLQAAAANFLTQISYEYKPQPIFPIINFDPNRHFYTPTLQFQPSQTNLMLDPLFADRLKGDYRLAPDSPLINRGRGGTYIGAFPPVIPPAVPPISPIRSGAAAAPVTTATSPGDTPAPAKPAAQGGEFRAWVQGGALYVQAEAVDAVLGRLRQRLAENPQSLERVKNAQVGVAPFVFVGTGGISLSATLTEDMATAVINSGFSLADPGLLNKTLGELGVKDSGALDQALCRELGQRVKCGFLLTGSVSDRGQNLVVSVRLLEAETGQYLAAERLEIAKATN